MTFALRKIDYMLNSTNAPLTHKRGLYKYLDVILAIIHTMLPESATGFTDLFAILSLIEF